MKKQNEILIFLRIYLQKDQGKITNSQHEHHYEEKTKLEIGTGKCLLRETQSDSIKKFSTHISFMVPTNFIITGGRQRADDDHFVLYHGTMSMENNSVWCS